MGARRSKMKGRTTICVLAAAVCLLDSLTRADVDDNDYAWDPNDRTGSKASTAADMEGTLEAPSNLWHACKFGANKADETLIELEHATGVKINEWMPALREALERLSGSLEQANAANAKKEARLDQLENRKKEAEAKKAKLGNVGMTHTASVMANKA